MYIPVILGTARKGSFSEKVAKFILGQAKEFGFQSELIDIKDFRIKATDNSGEIPEAKKWAKIVAKANGFIFVVPEYNHSYPGEFKMFLDMLFPEYSRKPVAICSVSMGDFAGARMIEHLLSLIVSFKMVPTGNHLMFPKVREYFDSKGKPKNKVVYKRAENFLTELALFAKALKQ